MNAPQTVTDAQIRDRLEAVGAPADDASVVALARWLALHAKWSRIANLTGTREAVELLDVHLTDCAAIVPRLPPGCIVDVGSGSGLPGLVIAALERDRAVVLVDAASKRTRFLEQAALELGLTQVEIVTARCEAWRPAADHPVAAVVARALAPLERLVAWTGHLLQGGTPLLAMKGPRWRDEAQAMPAGYRIVDAEPYEVPGTGREHVLVRIEAATADAAAPMRRSAKGS